MEGVQQARGILMDLRRIGSLLFFPAIALHELSHYAAAKALRTNPELHLWEEEPQVTYSAKDRSERVLVNLMPTMLGLMVLPAVHPFFGIEVISVYITASWAIVTIPSRMDVAGMLVN